MTVHEMTDSATVLRPGAVAIANERLIAENRRVHDEVAARYDERHPEIYNRTEQQRLVVALRDALGYRETANSRSLDFGSGTGNLTRKLLELDPSLEVHAADLSPRMLRQLAESCPPTSAGRLRMHTLDGSLPLPFPDRYFGFVAAYSVLHHIPDYLALVRELIRILDDGGGLFIDHESNEEHWRSPIGVRLHRALTMPGYVATRVFARCANMFGFREPELPPPGERVPTAEGDIHIFADDHVEWSKIRALAKTAGVIEIEMKDYLLCQEAGWYPWRYAICRRFATDMGTFIGRRAAPGR